MITDISQLDSNARYSYSDYLSWKFEERVEIIKGTVLHITKPNRKHQSISWNLTPCIDSVLKQHKCGAFAAPFDVRLLDSAKSAKADKDIFTVVQPDLCVICDKTKLDTAGCLGSPDLIIEILSPGNSKKEMRLKKNLYEENGVLEYWVFDPNQESVTAFVLDTEKGVYQAPEFYFSGDIMPSAIFENLKIDLKEIFED